MMTFRKRWISIGLLTAILMQMLMLFSLSGCYHEADAQPAQRSEAASAGSTDLSAAALPMAKTLPEPEPEPTEPEPTQPPRRSQDVDWPSPPVVYARCCFVYDCKDQDFRYMYGAEDRILYPASVTKIMTAYVALRYLPLEREILIGEEVGMILGPRSSQIRVRPGEIITMEELLKGMLIPSGCDAAYVMAAAAGRVIAGDEDLYYRDAVAVFVEEMNKVGEELGLVNSSFATPDGQHRKNHYICLSDYARIAAACMEVEAIRETVCQQTATVTLRSGRTIKVTSTNPHINPDSKYYIPECVGLKTGSSKYARLNLITAYWVEDRYILVGVFSDLIEQYRSLDTVRLFNTYGKFPEEA